MKATPTIVVFIVAFVAVMTAYIIRVQEKIALHKRQEQIIHLKDGRYAYHEHYHKYRSGAVRDNSTNDWIIWYWLMLTPTAGTPPNAYYVNKKSSSSLNFEPPDDCIWVDDSFTTSPTPKDLEEPLDIEDEDVVVDNAGDPQVDGNGNLVDPEIVTATPETSEDADANADSSSSSDSSSASGDGDSDSAGGGDGGGD